MEHLTTVIRGAYQQLADLGFRYWGTWQSVEDTKKRCSSGTCLVAEEDGEIVGTITIKKGDETDPDFYRREDIRLFTQFAVSPHWQRSGIGSRLVEEAEKLAFQDRNNL